MGEVYLARDAELDRKVAIKYLPESLVADEQARKRLVREARAAAKLDHPNICAIHEVGEEDGTHYLSMEFVFGRDLGQILTHGEPERGMGQGEAAEQPAEEQPSETVEAAGERDEEQGAEPRERGERPQGNGVVVVDFGGLGPDAA